MNHVNRHAIIAAFGPVVAAITLSACGSGIDGQQPHQPSLCPVGQVANINDIEKSGRFLVKLRSDGSGGIAHDGVSALIAAKSDGANVDSVRADLYAVENETDGVRAANIARELAANPGVEYVEPDYEVHGVLSFNDPSASEQWAHGIVESAKAWDIGTGKEILVGVIDSGIDYTHPDLKNNMWVNPRDIRDGKDNDGNGYIDDVWGWDFVNSDSYPMADDTKSYHGTHVAGTIGAVSGNSVGITGHAPHVKLVALKFLNSSSSGYTSNAIKAIDYSIKIGVKVLNNSWGGGSYSESLASAISRANAAGILFVAAAGNAGGNYSIYPANYNYPNVLSVASTTSSDYLSSFSNYHSTQVDVAAPGSSIYSTRNGSTYAYLSGTSMATPLVSGIGAMMMGLRPDLTPGQIRQTLIETSEYKSQLYNKTVSDGRVNAYKAMLAIKPSATPTPTPDPTPDPTPSPTPDPSPTGTPTPAPTDPVQDPSIECS